jgi:hypothetical protein
VEAMRLAKKFCLNAIGLVLLIGSFGFSQAAADDSGFPQLNEGQWETTSTTQLKGQKSQSGSGTITFDCIQPTMPMKQEITNLEKSGCKASSVTRVRDEYGYTLGCGARGTNRYTLKFKSQDEFIQTVLSEKSGDIYIATFRRIGNCKTAAPKGVPGTAPQSGTR